MMQNNDGNWQSLHVFVQTSARRTMFLHTYMSQHVAEQKQNTSLGLHKRWPHQFRDGHIIENKSVLKLILHEVLNGVGYFGCHGASINLFVFS